MHLPGILIDDLPQLTEPVMIAGFDGWGNALNVSKAMAAYMIRKLKAVSIARLDADTYYRFDEHRPVVTIEEGQFRSLVSPGGEFFVARPRPSRHDVVILEAVEPSLNWHTFARALLDLCRQLDVQLLVTIGSMYDNLLHTDRLISGVASGPAAASVLKKYAISAISYQGPSAIHSVIMAEAGRRRVDSLSLWCHCPYYLQGTTHFGQLLHLAALLSEVGGFELELTDLQEGWHKLRRQIDELVEKNSALQQLVADLRKRKTKGSIASVKNTLKADDKVINLQDFFDGGHQAE